MVFFFVGGLGQQVRQVLKSNAGQCTQCRWNADLVDYDKVLKIFFFPVWRWPGKVPLMYCKRCELFLPQSYSGSERRCQFCGQVAKPDFNFCPFCRSTL